LLAVTSVGWAQTAVTTWHYDNARTGANTKETILTPQNVNSTKFGKLFVRSLDGAMIGQALYLPGVKIPGKGTHNVVYATTMHDSVYAFDADNADGSNAQPLWHRNFLRSGVTTVPINLQGCQPTTGWTEVGIVSTPVIDTVAGTLFVVAKTYENSSFVHRLHALDVATGLERTNSPVVITAKFESAGASNLFADAMQVNRPGLLLENNHVYIAFGSNGCRGAHEQGWVMSYDSATLQLEGAFDDEPSSSGSAIWQRGGGLSSDNAGNIYGTTADGYFKPGINFGESVLKLSQVGNSIQLTDWFTPYNLNSLNKNDLDLSEPVLVLPDQGGQHPHLALAAGKEGTIYVLNRDNMGHFCNGCTKNTQIVEELPAFAPETGALVYWNNAVYTSGADMPIKSLPMSNGVLSKTPSAQSTVTTQGHSPIISANGTANGILWQMTGSKLQAFNAKSLAKLYSSLQATDNRDVLPAVPHFTNFVVANGKVYIGTNNSLITYGLF
jgi:hypothetical protein